MARIPVYQRDQQLDPSYTSGIDVRATPSAFGADVARGMQAVGQGIGDYAQAKYTLEEKLQENAGREALLRAERMRNSALYDPDGGLMTRQGIGARGAAAQWQKMSEEIARSATEGLSGRALEVFQKAWVESSVSTEGSLLGHEATQVRGALDQSFVSLIDSYAESAVKFANDPRAAGDQMRLGAETIRERAALQGWDAATTQNLIDQFNSDAHKGIALSIASKDPLAAQKYIEDNRDMFVGSEYEAVAETLKPAVEMKQAADAAAGYFAGAGSGGQPSASYDGTEEAATRGGSPTGRSNTRLPLVDGKHEMSVTNLNGQFVSSLETMIAAMPPELQGQVVISSGWRPATRAEAPPDYVGQTQDEIYAAAVAKYGEGEARKWAAPAGKSNHNHGMAADLQYASDEARQWVLENASKFGLALPLSNEPWHIEPASARDGSGAPTFDPMAIESYVSTLPPEIQQATRTKIYGQFELISKAQTANREAAQQTIWDTILTTGKMPTDVNVLSAAGMSAVKAGEEYLAKGGDIATDLVIYGQLTELRANQQDNFLKVNLNNYRTKLSPSDWKEMKTVQEEMRAKGTSQLDYSTAYDLTKEFVDLRTVQALGAVPKEKDTEYRQYLEQMDRLNRMIEADMKQFQKVNSRPPEHDDIQKMVIARTLPTIKGEDTWYGSADRGMAFEMGTVGGQGFELEAEAIINTMDRAVYDAINADLKAQGISAPTPEQIAEEYQNFLLWGTVDTNEDGGQ